MLTNPSVKDLIAVAPNEVDTLVSVFENMDKTWLGSLPKSKRKQIARMYEQLLTHKHSLDKGDTK